MPIKHEYQANILRYQLWYFFAIFHRLMPVLGWVLLPHDRVLPKPATAVFVTQWMPHDTERGLKSGASRQPYPLAIAPLHRRCLIDRALCSALTTPYINPFDGEFFSPVRKR